jgi:hypothetical protein
MNDYAKAFKEGEQEGQNDAQKEIANLRAGGELSDEYAFKLGKNVLFTGFIVGLLGFFYFLIFRHLNFFLAALLGFVVYFVSAVLYALFHVVLLKLASRKK